MEQAITDYVKFLADARDAVYRLNNDQAIAKQLKEQGERQEKELAAAKKADGRKKCQQDQWRDGADGDA